MDNEEFENEEMTPEEESFPVNNTSRPIRGSSQFNSNDAKNLQNIINKNKTKNNPKNNVGNNSQSDANNNELSEDSQTKNNEDSNKEKSGLENKKDELANEAATEALRQAAIAAGVPKPLVDAALKTETAQKAIQELIDKYKKKKKQIWLKILGACLPYLLLIFITVFTVAIIMTEFYEISAKVDEGLAKATETYEKFLNFSTGKGWNTEEEEFFKNLKKEYENSKPYTLDGKGIDVPLIAATIHYNYMIDIDIYDDDHYGSGENLHLDESLGSEDSLFSNFIEAKDTKSFYVVANDKLGEITPLTIGRRRLLGHLVKPEFTWGKYTFKEALNKWGDFFRYLGEAAPDFSGIFVYMIDPSSEIQNLLKHINSYADQKKEKGSAGWMEYTYYNYKYEVMELIDYFNNKGDYEVLDSEDKNEKNIISTIINTEWLSESALSGFLTYMKIGAIFPAPNITYTYTEEVYKDYLRNVYIPLTYDVGEPINYGNGDTNADYRIDNIITEIYEQKETFYYLFNIDERDQYENCHYEYGSSDDDGSGITATVNGNVLDSNLIDNLYVNVSGETVSFEDYIMGVVHGEIYASKQVDDYIKANMIAEQTFVFSRSGGSLVKSDGKYYINMENSSNAQNYCNVYNGCERKRNLTEEQISYLKSMYSQIKYKILYSDDGKFVGYYRNTHSRCMQDGYLGKCLGQADSLTDAQNGMKYEGILGKYYTDNIHLYDLKSGKLGTRKYVCYSSGLISGSHGDFPIRTSGPNRGSYPYSLLNQANYGECVWYAKGRAMEIISTVNGIDEETRKFILSRLQNQMTGNGNQYCDRLIQLKAADGSPLFGTSTDPHQARPGALACYDSYSSTYKEWYGHVIVIEDVNGSNVTISQAGKGFSNYFNTRTYTIDQMATIPGSTSQAKFIRYVYLLD